MKHLLFIFLFCSALFAQNNSILILNSYHKGFEWSDRIVKGLEDQLKAQGNMEVDILYMDSKRVTSSDYKKRLERLYEVQLKQRQYDLIISVDQFAYEFILDVYDRFFTSQPIFAVGLNQHEFEVTNNIRLKSHISAYLLKKDLNANVRLIETLYPYINKLYIVHEEKSIQIQNLIDGHDKSRYELSFIKNENLNILKKRFEKSEPQSAILFIDAYKNSDASFNSTSQIMQFIQHSALPVFVTDTVFVSQGVVGGRLIDLKKFGKEAAKQALRVLQTKEQHTETSTEYTYIFDANELRKFNISIVNLGQDYQIVNRTLTFFEKNRRFIDFIFTISPILILLILWLFHNIYMRRQVEQELRQRIEVDTVLLNAIESPIFWQNKHGIIIDSNSKFCNLIGMNCLDIYGYKLKDFKSNSKVRKVMEIIRKYKDTKDNNVYYRTTDEKGNKKIYLLKQAKYHDTHSDTSGVVTIFTDVTHEKFIEIERERNQQFMIQQTKLAEIGEIFSSIAHQWKAPLVEITTIAQENFYAQNVQEGGEDESYVMEIMNQVKYMNDTINDFQDFIKPSHQKIIFDVHEAITSMLDIVSHNVKYNYLQINIDVKKDTNTMVKGYRNEFMQSFLNIINNAKDELIKKDFKQRQINIDLYNKNDQVIIQIEDNAGGIEKKHMHNLFKPYFSTKEDGHGIGLYMTKMIIEDKMNGEISVKNGHEGACFTIKLGLKK